MSLNFIHLLSQSSDTLEGAALDEARWKELMLWTGILVVCLLAGAILFNWVKKKFAGAMEDDVANQELTLHDLRRLLREGQLTQEQFEKAKEKIIQQTRMKASPPGVTDRGGRLPDITMGYLYTQGSSPTSDPEPKSSAPMDDPAGSGGDSGTDSGAGDGGGGDGGGGGGD